MTSKHEHNTPQPFQVLQDGLAQGAMNERVEANILARAKAQLTNTAEDHSQPALTADRDRGATPTPRTTGRVWRVGADMLAMIVLATGTILWITKGDIAYVHYTCQAVVPVALWRVLFRAMLLFRAMTIHVERRGTFHVNHVYGDHMTVSSRGIRRASSRRRTRADG